ncbi:MAG: hypothetical protein NWQ54_20795, partial [Paraglaciecola sp.]|nr:hypothetical protein [Paraglaciecola sp.]
SFKPKFASEIVRGLCINTGIQLPKPPYIFGEHEISADSKAIEYMRILERWQFCGHFSRSVQHKQNQRAAPNSKMLWKDAEKLLSNL